MTDNENIGPKPLQRTPIYDEVVKEYPDVSRLVVADNVSDGDLYRKELLEQDPRWDGQTWWGDYGV